MSLPSCRNLLLLTVWLLISLTTRASAEEPSKEACLDLHSRGQDARERGMLGLSRKLFVSCAQSSCPMLVQQDCARFADELEHNQSSITFASRDAQGNDLPDTAVYLDGVLLLKRLDDGKARDVDPGRHVVRFSYRAEEKTVTVVVGTGEKGRLVSVIFETRGQLATATAAVQPQEPRPHSLGSRLLIGAGAAVAVGGAAVAVVGFLSIPSTCSLSTHECAAPAGSPAFDRASDAVRLNNVGWGTGAAGIAAVAAGLVWYVKGGKLAERQTRVKPIVAPTGAGLAISGRL